MQLGLVAILIVLGVIVAAIITHRTVEVMVVAGIVACIILYKGGFLTQYAVALQETTIDNVWLLLVCGLFGSLIALLQASKGSFGFTKVVNKLCKTERITLFTTFVLGIVIFVDDYLNVLSIGACMKRVYDKRKLPREALAYMLDSTGDPVCVLIPFSTWAVFFAGLFIEQEGVQALGYSSGIQAYIHAIPFSFYPIVALIIVFLFSMGWMPKLGSMKKAYKRVETTGELYSEFSKKYNTQEEEYEDGNIWFFLIPMIVLVAVTIITQDLMVAVVLTLIVCFVIYVPAKAIKLGEFFTVIYRGFADLLPILFLLITAFSLGGILENMGLSEFVIDAVAPYLGRAMFPLITFLLVAALTFVTGNLWGMCAIVAPIVFPLAVTLDANMLLVMAAIISGGAFGGHACFYTDATVLSASAAGIDNIEHAMSQLPYVLIGAGISCVLFAIAGVMM